MTNNFTMIGSLSAITDSDKLKGFEVKPFDPRVGQAVAKAVAEAAKKSGVARI